MIINIIFCIVISITLQVSEIYNLLGKDVPCFSGKGAREMNKIRKCKCVTKYSLKLLQAPFLISAFIIAANIKKFLKNIATLAPSDS